MAKTHYYKSSLVWEGNRGAGTMDYRAYDRDFSVNIEHKPVLQGSSDAAFMGDRTRHNPEDLLLASLSSCHMLWYLHLCSQQGIVVIAYQDNATGIMTENADGSGKFTSVTLHPAAVIIDGDNIAKALSLHEEANRLCFIAGSCNFPVYHEATCLAEPAG